MTDRQGGPDPGSKAADLSPRGGKKEQLLLDILDQEPTFESARERLRRRGRLVLWSGLGGTGLGAAWLLTGFTWLGAGAIVFAVLAASVGGRMPREMLELNRMRSDLADLRLRLERGEEEA